MPAWGVNAAVMTLREARLKAGYTQQMLADALGVTRQAVSEWERGLSVPNVYMAKRIAQELKTDVNEIEFPVRLRRRGVAANES